MTVRAIRPIDRQEPDAFHLVDGIYCNKDRTQLYHYTENKEDGKISLTAIKTRWGMPVLERVYQDDPHDDEHIDNHTYYEIRLSGRPHQGIKRFSHHQIEFGKWAAAFGGISIAQNSQQKMYANVIFEQQDAFDIPLEIMPEHTGFQYDAGTGVYHYVQRTGEHLHSDGSITNNHAPLARYSFDSESHTNHLTAWKKYEQSLPVATKELAIELLSWVIRVDPSGNLLLLALFSYRTLLCTIIPIETAMMAAAEDGTTITDGGSGSGKTSSIDFCRGVDGPTPYKAEQDAAFSGSLTGIETRINPLRDVLVSISDFHFNTESPSDKDVRDMADKFDAFIRSVSDNGEVKSRGRKNITAAQGTRIKAGLVFDGEMLPNLFLSRLRRAIILQFKRGVVDTSQLHSNWWEYQGKHTAIGRAIITSVLTLINTNRNDFAQGFKDAESKACTQIFEELIAARPQFDKAIARSLANNYARCLSPLYLLQNALGLDDTNITSQVQQAILRSITAFASMIDNGGPSQITSEWMINAINSIFEEREGYALAMDNSPLKGEEKDLLNRWGYERTGLVETPWAPGRYGVHLANLSDDSEVIWFRPVQLLNAVKKKALKDFPTFPYTTQTFPAFIVRLHVAEKANQRNTWVEKFNGVDDRRLKVTTTTVSNTFIDIEIQSGSSGSSGSDTPSIGSTSQSTQLPLSATALNEQKIAVATALNEQKTAVATALNEQKTAVADSGSYSDRSTGSFTGIATAVTAVTAEKHQFVNGGDIDGNLPPLELNNPHKIVEPTDRKELITAHSILTRCQKDRIKFEYKEGQPGPYIEPPEDCEDFGRIDTLYKLEEEHRQALRWVYYSYPHLYQTEQVNIPDSFPLEETEEEEFLI